MVLLKEFSWDSVESYQKRLLAAAYGQISFGHRDEGEIFIELSITDDRFQDEESLPWDAYAELEEGSECLMVTGNEGPSGYGKTWTVTLPDDVIVSLHIWETKG